MRKFLVKIDKIHKIESHMIIYDDVTGSEIRGRVTSRGVKDGVVYA